MNCIAVVFLDYDSKIETVVLRAAVTGCSVTGCSVAGCSSVAHMDTVYSCTYYCTCTYTEPYVRIVRV